jgi:general L-amino acid transport system substrate-binding protein
MLNKKVFILLAALVASVAVLVACGGGLSEEDVEERAQTLAAERTPSDTGMTEEDVNERAEMMAQTMVAEQMEDDKMETSEPEGSRLDAIRSNGALVCAVNNALAGFGYLDDDGNAVGFDIDLCRAVAVAVLGDSNSVEYRPTTGAERGPAMQSGEVDIMSRNTTWTSFRDATWGNFAQTMFYDGQGFMAHTSLGVASALELQGAKVCVQKGTTTELNLQDFSNQNNLNMDVITFKDNIGAIASYQAEQCDAYTTDKSGLVANRSGFDAPDDHVILPETISEEPLGPVVPHGDEQWYDIVKAVMAMLIYAEAYGISSDNVPTAATGNPAIDRMLGFEGGYGQDEMGLSKTVAQDVIRAMGNYGEIYDRHLTPLGLPRENTRNALWDSAPCSDCPKGGQVYAAPLR